MVDKAPSGPKDDTGDESAATAISPRAAQPKPRTRRQPPYALILENDDDHTCEYVVHVLQKVCHHSQERAYQLAMEAHEKGRSIVWTGTLELAELKRDQIRGFGPDNHARRPITFPLGVTVEPLPGD